MTDLQRYLLVAALIALLILIHEAGHFLCAKALRVPVREFALGFGPRLLGFQWDETDVRLNLLPLGGYCAFVDDDPSVETRSDDPRLLRNRPVWQRFLVVSGGVAANYAGAFVLLLVSAIAIGTLHFKMGDLQVMEVMADQPAAQAGFHAADRILSVDGHAVEGPDAFISAVGERANRPTVVAIRRDGHDLAIRVTPNARGKIGVKIQPSSVSREYVKPTNPLAEAIGTQGNLTRETVMGFVKLVSGQMSANDLGGVVEIGRAGAYVAKNDLRDMLSFTAMISIGLAVMNVLPLPALDGGHMVFLIIEAIRRRPVPKTIEEPIQRGGLVLLLGLMTLLLIKDIVRPIKYPELPNPSPSASLKP
jgi:membrane-associated protease RseP (regulator of RpoE activity)